MDVQELKRRRNLLVEEFFTLWQERGRLSRAPLRVALAPVTSENVANRRVNLELEIERCHDRAYAKLEELASMLEWPWTYPKITTLAQCYNRRKSSS